MLNRPSVHLPVVIVGSGFVGSLMALALSRLNIPIIVMDGTALETHLHKPKDGRAISLTHNSRLVFESYNLWDTLAAYVQPLSKIYTTDTSGAQLKLKADDLPHKALGYMVDSKQLKDTLLTAVQKTPGIQYVEDTVVNLSYVSPFNHAIEITGKTGQRYKCALLIGADGAQSTVRKLLNLRVHQWSYDQTAFVRVYSHSNPHQGVAYEKFLPTGPFAILPLQNHHSSIVWTITTEKANHLATLPDHQFDQEAFNHMAEYQNLAPTSPLWRFNIKGCWTPHFTTARAALVGDAAHVIHPLAGQGFNLGIQDVAALAQVVQKGISLGLDIGSPTLLHTYHRQQRLKHLALLGVTDGLNRLFSNEDAILRWMRRVGLNQVDQMPSLKSFFMEHGTGGVSGESAKVRTTEIPQ